jgi:hypothetical protein
MISLSIFGFVWTMHTSGEYPTKAASPGIAGQIA